MFIYSPEGTMKPEDLVIGKSYRFIMSAEVLMEWDHSWGTSVATDMNLRDYVYDGYDCGEYWFLITSDELADIFEDGQISFDLKDIECLQPLECNKSKAI